MTKKYHIGIYILHLPYYRTMGSIIVEACRTPELDVEIFLGPPIEEGSKQRYSVNKLNIPDPLKNICKVTEVRNLRDLVDHLKKTDGVITITGRRFKLETLSEELKDIPWFSIFDAYHSTIVSHYMYDSSLSFFPTKFYLDLAIKDLKNYSPSKYPKANLSNEDIEAAIQSLNTNSVISGYARIDGIFQLERDEIRREWNIPIEKKVVLYIPDVYRFGGAGRDFASPWYYHIWCQDNVLIRLFNACFRIRNLQAIRDALNPFMGEAAVLNSLRKFCDNNNALLVMFPRRAKEFHTGTGRTEKELSIMDVMLSERNHYPQSLPKAMKMTDLVVSGYRSGSVTEAIGLNIPYVTIAPPIRAIGIVDHEWCRSYDKDRGNTQGSVWLIDAESFARNFKNKKLDDYKFKESLSVDSIRKHIGPIDGNRSRYIIKKIISYLKSNYK